MGKIGICSTAVNELLSQNDDIQRLLKNDFKLRNLSSIFNSSASKSAEAILKKHKEITSAENESTDMSHEELARFLKSPYIITRGRRGNEN